jgi:glycosyltransferase involved in cell wall biosynthesis
VAAGFSVPAGGSAARGRERAGASRYVLSVGTVEPRKNLAGLVVAFDQVADDDDEVRLVLAGGNGWGAHNLDDAIAGARHRARIVRLGWIDDQTRADLLAGATALAYPSRYEGFGLPPLEAMWLGTPTIVSNTGALPEVCGDGAVQVDPDDARGLASRLDELFGSPKKRAALSKLGQAQARKYTWDATAKAYAEVYAEALE